MPDKKKKSKRSEILKGCVKAGTGKSNRSEGKICGKAPGDSVNISEDAVSENKTGGLIWEVLSEQMSVVAKEIIAEIELDDNDKDPVAG